LTHTNIVKNAFYIGECMKLGPEDRVCIPVPFFHCFGCVLGTLNTVTHEGTMVPVESFDAEEVLEAVDWERCTALLGVPTMFIRSWITQTSRTTIRVLCGQASWPAPPARWRL